MLILTGLAVITESVTDEGVVAHAILNEGSLTVGNCIFEGLNIVVSPLRYVGAESSVYNNLLVKIASNALLVTRLWHAEPSDYSVASYSLKT